MIPSPHLSSKPDRFDVVVKVGITAEDHLGLTWLAQTAGMSRSGLVRSLIRKHLTESAVPAAATAAPGPEGAEGR